MAVERTLCIIKPDAVEKKRAGAILHMLEDAGFTIVACKRMGLSRSVAEGFYAVHKARPFFGELVEFMMRSPVFVVVLEREDAVAKYRRWPPWPCRRRRRSGRRWRRRCAPGPRRWPCRAGS